MNDFSWQFTLGIALLLTNQPIGWGGIIFCTYLGKKTGKKMYYLLGTGIYALSWGLLALGMYMAGPAGINTVKDYCGAHKLQAVVIANLMLMLGAGIYIWRKKQKLG